MYIAKLFRNGDSQAIRLPKIYRFQGNEVYIKQEGKNIILSPIDDTVNNFWNTLDKFSSDLQIERNQPKKFDKRKDL